MKRIKNKLLIAIISATVASVFITLLEYLFIAPSLDKAFIIQKLITYCIVIIALYIGLRVTKD